MKQFTRLYNVLPLLAMLCLASCASEELNDRLLPAGKYPMTFATAMEGLTQTRATTDNIWTGNEKIAVQVGSEVKEYKPTNGNPSTLTAVNAINSFYWQKTEETVSAWYSGADYHATLPTSFSVKPDQSNDGYQRSDFLYAKPQNIKYSNRTTSPLIFKHLPAKVVVNLKYGDGLTAQDVANATVSIINQATTSGKIDATYGTVAQVTTFVSNEITPNPLAAVQGYEQSVQALVVPQQMQSKKFIKVTVGTGANVRDYYYTPQSENDANLECGKQYTYDITVKKSGLEVSVNASVNWNDETVDSGDVSEATFHVTLSGAPLLAAPPTLTGINKTATDKVYKTDGNSFSFSYTTSNRSEIPTFSIGKGMATETETWEATPGRDGNNIYTYTYTCTNIRSDLWLNHVEVGYYYYADGTCSSEYTDGEPACIGVVFWLGDATQKDKILKADHPRCTHGLVVALKDAVVGTTIWQEPYSSIQNWLNATNLSDKYLSVASGIDSSDPSNNIQGYNNTKAIEEYNAANVGNPVQAILAVDAYRDRVKAPRNSSDWYLPSEKELSLLCGKDVNDIFNLDNSFTDNRDLINSKLSLIDTAVADVLLGNYWSSTEYQTDNSHAFYVVFKNGYLYHNRKNYSGLYNLRCVLAF